ncbi:MAG: hypothetical protein GWN00_05685, partial [Aliifodinibius sp.]|nr:hypothetical protein [Phycisphaerae bacterium]NIT55731.1 hypothetical protein [Fodinibius sp.]NIV00258.1 hypothetical protein [Phycisphaerae bacterium]NIV70072.1 hypothetical protein [Phycisphaerae bacterium]NIW97854.1 hypothetical protein [Phycisphaerae bacterium]
MVKVEDIKTVIHDIKFKHVWKLVIALPLLVGICGCQPSWVNKLGDELDQMAKGREKFGTISLSEPILVESKKDQPGPFDFTLKTGPDDYYNDARNIVQGKMASSSQFIKDTGVDLTMQADISALAAYNAILKQYEQEVAALDARNKLLSEARDLEAQKVIAALPDDATEEQILEARAKAAKIRAGEDSIAFSEFPTSTPSQTSHDTTPPGGEGRKNMTGFLALLEGTPDLKISNRSAINTAAGDTVTEAIFTLLGNPARTARFKDKLMLFGVSMVSITPGYVTREGYTGELSVACCYNYDIARRNLLEKIEKVEESKGDKGDTELLKLIKKVINKKRIKWDKCNLSEKQYIDKHILQRYQKVFREEFTPLAAAVSPMTDVDALDLSSSIRNQTFSAMKISAALSYAGFKGQAEVFDNWARKLEQDTQTRTSYAAITSFSSGRHFGFRIRPRLKAIRDDAALDKTPGYVLENQTFPVAVIVGFDTDDLKLAFDFERKGNGRIKWDPNGMARIIAYEPTIEFHQTTNWLPNKEVSLWDKLWGNELTETRRLEWLDSYIKETEKIIPVKKTNIDDINYCIKYVDNRVELLSDQILGTYSAQYLPMEFLVGKPVKRVPKVNEPNHVFIRWFDAPSTYVIKGKNFEGQVVGANIEGQPCEIKVVADTISIITSSGWTPRPDAAAALAEKQIAEDELDIAKANKKINDAQKKIYDANEILQKDPSDQAAIKIKKQAEDDLTSAKTDLAIAKANKGVAEAAKRSAMVKTRMSKELQIDLITTKGSIKAGFVRFTHQ